jgi:hypothetical protein
MVERLQRVEQLARERDPNIPSFQDTEALRRYLNVSDEDHRRITRIESEIREMYGLRAPQQPLKSWRPGEVYLWLDQWLGRKAEGANVFVQLLSVALRLVLMFGFAFAFFFGVVVVMTVIAKTLGM